MLKKIFLFFIILFLILGGLGYWYWSRNAYSKDSLKVEILGPSEANFADEVEYTVKYKNNGNIRLEQPKIIFEYPENTMVDGNFISRQEVGSDKIGDIYPGEEKTYTFKGRLFGKEGDLKKASVELSYQPKNLNARYESKTTFTTKIKPVPLTFDFDLPSKIEANKKFDFSIDYYSALNYPLSDLTVKIQYPDKFQFLKSDPNSQNENEWDVPLLNKAEGGKIDISGQMAAELGDHGIFNAQLGMWRSDGEFIPLKDISQEVEIVRPNLSISQKINGQAGYTASPGDLLHYEISFRNLGTEPFTNLFLAVTLDGGEYDLGSIKSSDGQFKSGDNTIVWDSGSVPNLKFLDQGEEGTVEFWINLKDGWNQNDLQKNGLVKDTVLISKIKQTFETKINSNLAVVSEVSKDSNSTYTINWLAKNSSNDMKNVKVKAILPPNVKLTGQISPQESSSNFAFDNDSREIVWMVGDMPAGTGVSNDPITISFQAETNSRSGNPLLDQIRMDGEDSWTELSIEKAFDQVEIP